MTKIEITQENGYFLINGKKYIECNFQEQDFFNNFIISMRSEIGKILYIPAIDVEILK